MFNKPILLPVLAIVTASRLSAAVATIEVFNEHMAVLDSGGAQLTAGTNVNGDGAVIQVGYLDGVNVGLDPSSYGAGEWNSFTPIAGGGLNGLNTSVGDNDSGAAGPFGLFSFSTGGIADTGTNVANAAGQRLALRIWNGTSIGSSTHYNTVTGIQLLGDPATDEWLAVLSASNPVPTSDISILSLSGPGAAGAALTWEDNTNPFRTSIAIPEPSGSLLGLAACALFLRRKR